MPIDVARPSGPGDFTEWDSRNVSGAALANWQAVSTGSPNQFILAAAAGRRDRYVVPPLPAAATGVERVTVFALVAGDDVGQVRVALRLGGIESYGDPFLPPNGGYDLFFFEFPLAPGGLPWTVARRNAIQFGPDSFLAHLSEQPNVDEVWLETSYLDPVATAEIIDRRTIASPGSGRQSIACPARRVTVPAPGGTSRLAVTCAAKRVLLPVPLAGRARITIAPERD